MASRRRCWLGNAAVWGYKPFFPSQPRDHTREGMVGMSNGKGRRNAWPNHPSPHLTATFSGSIHACFMISSVKHSYETQANLPSILSPHCLAEQGELILWSHHQGAAGTTSFYKFAEDTRGFGCTSYLSQPSPNQALTWPRSTPPLGSGDKLKELAHPLTASFAKVNVTTSFACNKLLECVYWRADKYTDDGCHLCNQRTLECSLKSTIQPKLADFGLYPPSSTHNYRY